MIARKLTQPGKEIKSVMLGPQHTSRRWRFNVEKKGSLDKDAREYINRAGVKNAQGRQQISDYVRGLKANGWWGIVVSFPLRFHQNSESGSTMYALGRDFEDEQFSASIVGTPARSPSGLVTAAQGNYLSLSRFAINDANYWIGGCARVTDTGNLFEQGDSVIQIQGGVSGNVGMLVFPPDPGDSGSDIPGITSFSTAQGFFQFTGVGDDFTSKKNASARSAPYEFFDASIGRSESASIANCPGTMAFFFFASAIAIENFEQDKFYNLYKSTLGQGLGLP